MANQNIILVNPNVVPAPTRVPHVPFAPVKGGLRDRHFISQEAINFLTECVWENSPDICTPTKLKTKSAPSCFNFAQVAMLMVHPMTGKSISSCLMHNPAMLEVCGRQCLVKILVALLKVRIKRDKKALNQFLSWLTMKSNVSPKIKLSRMLASSLISVHKKQAHTVFESRWGGISLTTPENCLPVQQTLPHPNWCGIVSSALRVPSTCVLTSKITTSALPWIGLSIWKCLLHYSQCGSVNNTI